MALSDHVVSLQLAKKWKEIGGRQDTEFYWAGKPEPRIFPEIVAENDPDRIAAPLASEAMEIVRDSKSILSPDLIQVILGWWCRNRNYQNLPNALLMMAIELKEKEGK